jgi:hypothetical protein
LKDLKRLRQARLEIHITLDDRIENPGSAYYVVRFYSQKFLERV